jgi:hypothetical protein
MVLFAICAMNCNSENDSCDKAIKRDTVRKTKREERKNLLPSIKAAPTESKKGGAVFAEAPVLRSRSEQQSRTKKDDLQIGQVAQTSSSAHRLGCCL